MTRLNGEDTRRRQGRDSVAGAGQSGGVFNGRRQHQEREGGNPPFSSQTRPPMMDYSTPTYQPVQDAQSPAGWNNPMFQTGMSGWAPFPFPALNFPGFGGDQTSASHHQASSWSQPPAAMNGFFGMNSGYDSSWFNGSLGAAMTNMPASGLAMGNAFFQPQDFLNGQLGSNQDEYNPQNPFINQTPTMPSAPSPFTPTRPLQAPHSPRGSPRRPPPRSAPGYSRPSAASGGVPEPTAAYLAQAALPPESAPEPQPLLVVIDLNGTLLYRPNKKHPHNFLARPHAKEFLAYFIRTFNVVVWSSARIENVTSMITQLLADDPGLRSQIVAVWGRDKFGLTREDYDNKTQCYKRLTRLWADPAIVASHPRDSVAADPTEAAGGDAGTTTPVRCLWDQTNTVLIDDSVEKARSEPHNAITIPEFKGGPEPGGKESPGVLPLVHDYLNTLSCQVDVSRYIRAHPFRVDEARLATALFTPSKKVPEL